MYAARIALVSEGKGNGFRGFWEEETTVAEDGSIFGKRCHGGIYNFMTC